MLMARRDVAIDEPRSGASETENFSEKLVTTGVLSTAALVRSLTSGNGLRSGLDAWGASDASDDERIEPSTSPATVPGVSPPTPGACSRDIAGSCRPVNNCSREKPETGQSRCEEAVLSY